MDLILTEFIDEIINWDYWLIQKVNQTHSPIMNAVMIFFTHKLYPIPLYALLLFLLFKKYHWKHFLILLPLIALLISCADYTASGWAKPFFERLRPCHDPFLSLDLPYRCGGKYGFFSSHASNSFAAAVFIFLHLRNKYKYIFLLLIWAVVVSYSRMYLGVHYLSDITVGAITGSFYGFLFYKLSLIAFRSIKVSLDDS